MSPQSWSAYAVSLAGGQAVTLRTRSRAPRPVGPPTPAGFGALALGAVPDVASPELATAGDFAQLFVIALCFFIALLAMLWWFEHFEQQMKRFEEAARRSQPLDELERDDTKSRETRR
jgi:peptidoglycan/LPS O-acetylase OafA/YrhL